MSRLTKWKCFRTNKKLYRANSKISISDLTWKLGHYEDIEDKIGIELTIYFEAILNGIYFINEGKIMSWGKRNINERVKFNFEDKSMELTHNNYRYRKFKFKDYGITWANKEEELL